MHFTFEDARKAEYSLLKQAICTQANNEEHLMDSSMRKLGPFTAKTWTGIILSSLGTLFLLAVCSNIFGWRWTGFYGNTVWDWLQLLLLPLSITGTTIWFTTQQQWNRQWTFVLTGVLLLFIILAIGGYLFHWKWTGFGGNTLWDWLKLLILPVVLPTFTVWFTVQPDKPGQAMVEQHVGDEEQTVHLPLSPLMKEKLT